MRTRNSLILEGNLSRPVEIKRYIPELDGVRTIAIALVIGCHYQAFAASFGGLLAFGWVGVDIFFVLSGFLITSILLSLKETRNAYGSFLYRRAVRIMPPYFLVLLFAALVFCIVRPVAMAHSVPTLDRHIFFFSSMKENRAYLVRTLHVFRGIAQVPAWQHATLPKAIAGLTARNFDTAVSHFWSVSVEEWYYVLWAPIVLFLNRKAIGSIAVFMILASAIIRWFGFANWEWYVNFLCRFDTLAFGGLLALWIEQRTSASPRVQHLGDGLLRYSTLTALGSLILLLTALRPVVGHEIRAAIPFAIFGPVLIGVIVTGVLAALIKGSMSSSFACRVLRSRPLVYVGRRSYMVYLAHVPVYGLIAFMSATLSQSLQTRLWLIALVSTVLSLTVAAVSWRFYEHPILSIRDRRRST